MEHFLCYFTKKLLQNSYSINAYFQSPCREAIRRKYQKDQLFFNGSPYEKFQEILPKNCLKLFTEQLYYQRIFSKSLQGSQQKKESKRLSIFLWLPLKEISGNVTKKLFKTLYRTVILSTNIFKFHTGKLVKEIFKKICYFLMAPPERNFRKFY